MSAPAAIEIEVLACPRCDGPLEAAGPWLQCARCRAPYGVRGGIPDLLPWSGGAPGEEWTRWREKLGLLQRWRRDTWDGTPAARERQDVADTSAARFFQFARLPAGRVLEVGCGSAELRRHVPHCAYWGLDPLAGDRPAGAAEREAGGNAPVLVRGVGEKLPFAPGAFAGVFLCETLDHALDPARVLREACRVLASGGVLAILQSVRSEAAGPPLWVRMRARAGRLKARLMGLRMPLEDRLTKMHVLERASVPSLVSAAGMAVEEVQSLDSSVMVRAIRRTAC
jgi:SAM-dependent methyltransferase